ncbi:hypothetical protein WJX72_004666 [[Myrmecia] bisecta]|uniref:J domain-containing protein n=1 Tax=[Myrmecia] bisecta TaxID=41462 RepID=A0AAW1PU51_9CHLO
MEVPCFDAATLQQGGSHYERLEVSFMASDEEIRLAYRRLAMLWHPDRHQGDELAKCRFQDIQRAYAVLKDPELRHEYDCFFVDCWNFEEYLKRFHDFILTVSGLQLEPDFQEVSPLWLSGHWHSHVPGTHLLTAL